MATQNRRKRASRPAKKKRTMSKKDAGDDGSGNGGVPPPVATGTRRRTDRSLVAAAVATSAKQWIPAPGSRSPPAVGGMTANGGGDGGGAQPPPGTQYVLAFDMEKTGQRTDLHSMVGLAAVVVRVRDGKTVASFCVFMQLQEGHGFGERCRAEYWYNWERFPMNQKILERIEKEGVSPKEGIQRFADWLDTQERAYSEAGLALVTDTVGSDSTWISHYFQLYLDRNPIDNQYGDEGKYRRIHHANAFGRALSLDDGSGGGDWCQRLREMGVDVPPAELADHDPLNDALSIALLYRACLIWVRQQRYPYAGITTATATAVSNDTAEAD